MREQRLRVFENGVEENVWMLRGEVTWLNQLRINSYGKLL
jgi:hypothetical protein